MSNKAIGRPSAQVFRRRRLVVGFGLVAVLVIVTMIILRPGASRGEPDDTAGANSSNVPATSIPTTKTAVDGEPCDPSAVQVDAITDAVQYQPGVLPQLSLSLTNTGKASCVINAGTSTQVFTLTSGKDVYWTSTDCQTGAVDAEVTLKPGVAISSGTPISWDRTRSATDTCDAATRTAAPGGGASYYLTVSVDGIEAGSPKQILLY